MKKLPLIALAASGLIAPLDAQSRISNNYICDVAVETQAIKPDNNTKPKNVFPNVAVSKAPRNHTVNGYDKKNGTLNVYFLTNSWTLHGNDRQDIVRYLKGLPEGTNFLLEGYADFRGPIQDNLALSRNRIEGIEDMINAYVKNPRISKVAYGEERSQPEGTPTAKLRKDRRVSIIPNQTIITRGLEQLASDYYLLDQSESMLELTNNSNQSKWDEVKNYKFPTGSKVYTFTSDARKCGTELKKEAPRGGTPLYLSLAALVDAAEPGKSITVLTDGMDNGGGSPESIMQAAIKKKIKISIIGLGLPPDYEQTIGSIAIGTGGKLYLSR